MALLEYIYCIDTCVCTAADTCIVGLVVVCFGLSASDIKAYVLNRHLKTLAGILFDLPAKRGLNLFLRMQGLKPWDSNSDHSG